MNCENHIRKTFEHTKKTVIRGISAKTEKIFKICGKAMMPAGCRHDFKWSLSPQSPAATEIDLKSQGVIGRKAQMIVQESAWGMMYCIFFLEARKYQ